MKLTLISDEKLIFEGEVSKVTCLSPNGLVEIMDNHIPYITTVRDRVSYTKENGESYEVKIQTGYVYTAEKECVVVVDTD